MVRQRRSTVNGSRKQQHELGKSESTSSAVSSDIEKPISTRINKKTINNNKNKTSMKPRRLVSRASSLISGTFRSDGIKTEKINSIALSGGSSVGISANPIPQTNENDNDRLNYLILTALYTIQGIPIGLASSIPLLIQQRAQALQEMAASSSASSVLGAAAEAASTTAQTSHNGMVATKMVYNAQAIFSLCSWPFSMKLLWAPIVDACFSKRFGRRKTWIVPVQATAGICMLMGSKYVENHLGLAPTQAADGIMGESTGELHIKGVTAFFFFLFFLMATQDIAVDGWALTMLSKKNRGRGPLCNTIGQNIGSFFAYAGFLALNDPESSEKIWRPLLRLKPKPGVGLVSLGGFIRSMGIWILGVTFIIAIFKREVNPTQNAKDVDDVEDEDDDAPELDASEIGLRETYHRLLAVCKLPSVQSLFMILLTFRFPTSLSDYVKNLKSVDFGLSKQTIAFLSPTIILPLGIIVPIVANKIWHGHPLKQFIFAYKYRVTLIPLIDVLMLHVVRIVKDNHEGHDLKVLYWVLLIASTALGTIASTLQFSAAMTFFASRVDPAIGGTYMTLLNTITNLGGTWPAAVVMYLVGKFTIPETCEMIDGEQVCSGGRDAYFPMQLVFSILGLIWIFIFEKRVMHLSHLPEDSWRTHHLDDDKVSSEINSKMA